VATGGLRERKKQRTRETILRVAFELFAERGYQGTTVVDIAEAAEISPSTLFAYFPSKDDIVFANYDEIAESLRLGLEQRQEGQSAADAIREWSRGERRRILGADGHATRLIRRRIIESDPALLAQERFRVRQMERHVTAAVAADLGEDATDLRCRLVAAGGAAAGLALAQYEYEVRDRAPSAEWLLDAYEYVATFMEAGAEALSRLPRSPFR
jgi:AcrR family transcriptional regulator